MQRAERHLPPVIGNARDAEHLVDGIIAVMVSLTAIVSRETELLKTYRLRDAANLSDAKADAGRNYVHALEQLKGNAIALARWAPAAVARLKTSQTVLSDALTVNMAVLATARSVSEGIVRTLATDVAAPRTLSTYGAGGRTATPARPTATPLIVSKSL